MFWWCKEPGHQPLRHWPSSAGIFWFSTRRFAVLNDQQNIIQDYWYWNKLQKMFYIVLLALHLLMSPAEAMMITWVILYIYIWDYNTQAGKVSAAAENIACPSHTNKPCLHLSSSRERPYYVPCGSVSRSNDPFDDVISCLHIPHTHMGHDMESAYYFQDAVHSKNMADNLCLVLFYYG